MLSFKNHAFIFMLSFSPTKWWQQLILACVVGGVSLCALALIAILLIYPTLPSLDVLTHYQPKLPLRVYTADGYLINEYGEERRAFVKIEQMPKTIKDAVLAIEDRRFYQHHGVDYKGIARAIKNNVTGKGHEGASTITMQVAKNFFTSPSAKRNIIIKIKEILLAIKIERALSKDKILELYLNQIFLGQRAYGFAAASQVYFGAPLEKLSVAQSAFLAGLPKAPSGYNPFTKHERAIKRQHEVLNDMHRYGFITADALKAAMNEPLKFKPAKQRPEFLSADYVGEIVRQMLYEQYQEDIYSSGLKVYTTIYKKHQEAANTAVIQGIIDYQYRQGYQKPEKEIDMSAWAENQRESALKEALDELEDYNGFVPAIVTGVAAQSVKVYAKDLGEIEVTGLGLRMIAKSLANKNVAARKVKIGSVVRIIKNKNQWHIVQLPEVEAALVALEPENGGITALVGGFNFNKNKFNHVTQAWRQPGSSFKPFVYSAALEKGVTPATVFEDAPISIASSSGVWEPKNYDGKFEGPMRVRSALTKSKNMISIRIMQKIGAEFTQDYITKFGFSRRDHPAYLTMALGAGSVTPWGLAGGYAVFANGGYRVKPHLIAKITDSNGQILEEMQYPIANKTAARVVDARNAFIMTSMMRDVVLHGTAMRAKSLGRQDLAGKTGTTNNQLDAWFAGYMPKLVAVAWIGYDQPRSLGKDETGGKAALPIWIHYMSKVLGGYPQMQYKMPEGVVQLPLADGRYEYFYREYPPSFYTGEDAAEAIDPVPDFVDNSPEILDAPPLTESVEPPPETETKPMAESAKKPEPTPQNSVDNNTAAKILNPSGF